MKMAAVPKNRKRLSCRMLFVSLSILLTHVTAAISSSSLYPRYTPPNLTTRTHPQHSQFSSQHNVSRLNTAFGSTPHIPDYQPDYRPDYQPDYRDVQYGGPGGPGQFYLHEAQQQQQQPQRRTWAQHAQHAQINQENAELRGWQVGF